MAVPITPHIVLGIVRDIYGNVLEGVTVTVTHISINPVLTDTSKSDGRYRTNLGQLSSMWARGQTITVIATKAGEGTKTVVTTISSRKGSTTVNLTLEETSDIDYERASEKDNRDLIVTVPALFDGTKVTRTNRFPVINEETLSKYYYSDTKTDGSTLYDGYVDRDENWYIRREDTSTGEIRYVKGSGDYVNNFNNRTNLDYNYFYNVF